MNKDNHIYFDVKGAGLIEISKTSTYQCGGETGFSIGVEWGKHGYAGGVISKEEAIKLAEHILKMSDNKKLRKHKLNQIKKVTF